MCACTAAERVRVPWQRTEPLSIGKDIMSKIIGIDLYTTTSCVALLEGKQSKVIENSDGARTPPLVAASLDEDQILVGAPARRHAISQTRDTLYAFERDNRGACIGAHDERIASPQVFAEVLRKAKRTAGDSVDDPVTEAVIAVPAYFDDSRRHATRDAGKETVRRTGRREARPTKRRLSVLVPVIVIAGLWSENAMSASPPLPTLPLQHDIWITGTVQRGSGEYAPGEYTTITLDRPSTSPCNDTVVSDILLGQGGEPAPTLLLPYVNQRVAVRGRVTCPNSGIQFMPQPDVVFPVW